MKQLLLIIALLPIMVNATPELAKAIVDAATPEAKGLAIATMGDFRDTGWQDSKVEMTMILRNRKGKENTRETKARYMEINGDGDKSLTIFKQPRDIKGTAMLTWSHSIEADDQWLYLPALKRVKRISSKNKSGPFMGSEFAFEDLASQEIDKYSYAHLRDEDYAGINCYVVERKPAYKYSGYTRQIVWVDKEHFNPQQIVFYDRKNTLLKTLKFNNYKQYLNKYWRSDEMFMENHQTHKTTKLKFENYEFGNGFTNRDFDKTTLKRTR
ncbi:MAG: outer membrane lipoprotein-sorting protein [Candidatus Marithrix sp.]|nr:outer membrane lipoprotein-sorting protein [Candidatus Marithrix sp.]